MSMDRDIQFLYEIGSLRLIPRQWSRFLNTNAANITEHHFRVIWLALILAKYEKVKDTEKIIKMALVHDIAESRTGDVDYLSRQYVERNEELGARDMLGDTALEEEFIKLWQEYQERKSIESKIVKDADILDVDMEVEEQKAQGIEVMDKNLRGQRRLVYQNHLHTKSAKKIWRALQKSNPHDWHVKGRNRHLAGDWKN